MSRYLKTVLLATFVGASFVGSASAQDVPNSVQPGVIDKGLQDTQSIISDGRIIIPSIDKPVAPDIALGTSFILGSFTFAGNTVIPSENFAPFYEEHIGQRVSLAYVFSLANRITQYYADSGAALTVAYVPAQEIGEDGAVRITIVEGHVAVFSISGDVDALSDRAKRTLERMATESVLLTSTLERAMLLVNDTPGLTVTATVKPSDEGVGSLELVIDVKTTPFEGYVGVNNRGSIALGPWMAEAGFNINVNGKRDFQVSGVVMHSLDGNEMGYYSLALQVPINSKGTVLSAMLGRVEANPGGDVLRVLEFNTDSWNWSFAVAHPVIKSRNKNLLVGLTFEGKDSKSDILGFANSDESLRSLRLSGVYDWIDSGGGVTQFTGVLSQGLTGFGATENGSPLINRANGDHGYTSFKMGALRLQPLSGPLSLALSASGQYSGSNLLAPEQCGYGGSQFGRGFDSYEISGDSCFIASAELQFAVTSKSSNISNISPYLFADAGKVWMNNSPFTATGKSVGGGLRFTLFDRVSVFAEVAAPIGRDVALRNNRKARAFFGMRANF